MGLYIAVCGAFVLGSTASTVAPGLLNSYIDTIGSLGVVESSHLRWRSSGPFRLFLVKDAAKQPMLLVRPPDFCCWESRIGDTKAEPFSLF